MQHNHNDDVDELVSWVFGCKDAAVLVIKTIGIASVLLIIAYVLARAILIYGYGIP